MLADKLLVEGYARQAALAELKAREDRIKHQIALLSKSFLSFSSQSASSSSRAAAAATPADHDSDVTRCIDGIKRLQVRNHGGANEAVLISQLGLAINPKVLSAYSSLSLAACIICNHLRLSVCLPSSRPLQVDGLKQFLVSHPQVLEFLPHRAFYHPAHRFPTALRCDSQRGPVF